MPADRPDGAGLPREDVVEFAQVVIQAGRVADAKHEPSLQNVPGHGYVGLADIDAHIADTCGQVR